MTELLQIQNSVKAYYTQQLQTASSCCGDGGSCGSELYSDGLVDALPTDITATSFGCGDPISLASLQGHETVLDLGSGTGMDCFLAAQRAAYVIGVDMTPAMLEKAERNKAKLGVQNVEFRQGTIEELPLEANSIDVIISNCVINLSPDKSAVLREAFRVLKPGGRFAVSDMVTEGSFSPQERADMNAWSACVTGAIDAGAFAALMTAAGFVEVRVEAKNAPAADDTFHQNTPRLYSARITATKPA